MRLRRLTVIVLVAFIVSSIYPAVDIGHASHTVRRKDRPILFIHGVDAWDEFNSETSIDCATTWNDMAAKLDAEGYTRSGAQGMRYISYYYGDKNCSVHTSNSTTIEHHGKPDSDPHWLHDGKCCRGNQGHEGKGHNNEAYIQHLGYHLAWYIWYHYTDNSGLIYDHRTVDIVAHSMGGLIANYALMKVQQANSDFPDYLWVGDIVTLGSPLTGSNVACEGQAAGFQMAQMCNDPWVEGADTLLPYIAANGQDPQPSLHVDADWTLMGSYRDLTVKETSATGHPYKTRPTRGWDWTLHPNHWVKHGWADTSITAVDHSDYSHDTSNATNRWVDWQNKGSPANGSDGHIHVVQWSDNSLYWENW